MVQKTTDAERASVFESLDKEERHIFHVAHSKRRNTSEEYKSESVRAASKRGLDRSMEIARAVFALFTAPAKKN